jgi:glycerophosphoryl diester phosphodiesterase
MRVRPSRPDDTSAVPKSRFAFLDWPGPIAFAHQGGAAEFPSNTMKSFQSAVDMGYRYLETDLHVTKDGVLIVFHDDTLDRLTDHVGTIADLPWSVVQQARVSGTEPIPRFEDVLEALPDIRFNIEPKVDAAVPPFIDAVKKMGVTDRVCAASFSSGRLTKIRKELGPDICTAMGVADTVRLRIGSWLPLGPVSRWIAHTGAACAQEPVKQSFVPVADHRLVKLAHEMGLVVHVWTIDDAAEMNRLLDLGVDGIMTDRPSVLKEVLVQRNQWVS